LKALTGGPIGEIIRRGPFSPNLTSPRNSKDLRIPEIIEETIMHLSKSALLIAGAAFIGLTSLNAQMASPSPAAPPPGVAQVKLTQQTRTSPHETFSAFIKEGSTSNSVMIVYGRPFMKDPKSGEPRKIWGGVVPFDQVWRVGADEATLLITQQPLVMGGVEIPAGAVTLYAFPAADGSMKLVVNKRIGHWGYGYSKTTEASELARIPMKKDSLEKPVDPFTILIESDPTGGGEILKLQWENTQYSVPFAVKK
jgi:hypothetical protein